MKKFLNPQIQRTEKPKNCSYFITWILGNVKGTRININLSGTISSKTMKLKKKR